MSRLTTRIAPKSFRWDILNIGSPLKSGQNDDYGDDSARHDERRPAEEDYSSSGRARKGPCRRAYTKRGGGGRSTVSHTSPWPRVVRSCTI